MKKEFRTNKVILEELHEWEKVKGSHHNKFKMFLLTRKSSSSTTHTNATTKKELRRILKEWGY